MSNEKAVTVITQQPAAIQRHSLGDMQLMAKTMAASGLFSGIKTEQQAFALMLLCDAENIHPALALRRYHLINGTPAMKAETMLAEFRRLGGKVRWIKRDDNVVSATFHLNDEDSPPITWDDARVKQAGLSNPNHMKFPCQMKTARVISEGIRLMAPGIVQGIYTPEEVMDFQDPRPQSLPQPEPPLVQDIAPEAPFPPTLFERARRAQLSVKVFTGLLGEACADPVDVMAVTEIIRRCSDRVKDAPASLPHITAMLTPFAQIIHEAAPELTEQLAALGCPTT